MDGREKGMEGIKFGEASSKYFALSMLASLCTLIPINSSMSRAVEMVQLMECFECEDLTSTGRVALKIVRHSINTRSVCRHGVRIGLMRHTKSVSVHILDLSSGLLVLDLLRTALLSHDTLGLSLCDAHNIGLLSIKVLGNFFDGHIASLNDEEVDEPQLKAQEAAVADVVLPANSLHGDRVGVLIEA